MNTAVRQLLRTRCETGFRALVRTATTSNAKSKTVPTTKGQLTVLKRLRQQLKALGLKGVKIKNGTLYARLLASRGVRGRPFTLLAHVDTSPEVSGTGVKLRVLRNYRGGNIRFPDDRSLLLSPSKARELHQCIGHSIFTASGKTLLGADDKAGVAEIMAAIEAFVRYPDLLPHPEIIVCITTDEEIGQSGAKIDPNLVHPVGYTVDGGFLGELEDETWEAYQATVTITGKVAHPGYAYKRMVNAGLVASEIAAALPKKERPERTRGRDGFFYLGGITGECGTASMNISIRAFTPAQCKKMLAVLKRTIASVRGNHRGAKIELKVKHQYMNMKRVINRHPEIVSLAAQAMSDAGVRVRRKSIRGGTDGSMVAGKGLAYANLFSGAMNIHSKLEWTSLEMMASAAEVIVYLGRRYAEAA